MTMSRRVRRITVNGYKSIEQVELALSPVTVFAGPNGTGKTNFIEAVKLLRRINAESKPSSAARRNVTTSNGSRISGRPMPSCPA